MFFIIGNDVVPYIFCTDRISELVDKSEDIGLKGYICLSCTLLYVGQLVLIFNRGVEKQLDTSYPKSSLAFLFLR